MTTCHEIKHIRGISHWCILNWQHAGEHNFAEVVPHTLDYAGSFPAIKDEKANELRDQINEEWFSDGDAKQYSAEQVKRAMWRALDGMIDDLLDDLVERCYAYRHFDDYLGEPEEPRAETDGTEDEADAK